MKATRKLLRAERIKNSRNGNPRWRLTFDDGSQARTRADTAMTNGAEYQLDRFVGSDVALTFDGRGYVRDLAPLPAVRFVNDDGEWQALETGCALDGHYGWHNTYRVVREIAEPLGLELSADDDAILSAYEKQEDLVLTNGDGSHEWQIGRLTGTRTCARCGLLPLDADDDESTCETYLDESAVGEAASEIANDATEWLDSHTVGAIWNWDCGELSLVASCGQYEDDQCALDDPGGCAVHGWAAS